MTDIQPTDPNAESADTADEPDDLPTHDELRTDLERPDDHDDELPD